MIVRKKPQQRILSQAAMKVPDKLAQANTKDEDSVERTVRKIRKLIVCHYKEVRKPLDLFELTLHPHDFGKTNRNLLYISFLVKDGVIKLKKGTCFYCVKNPVLLFSFWNSLMLFLFQLIAEVSLWSHIINKQIHKRNNPTAIIGVSSMSFH